ncbi:hypothetical protein Vadar_017381 [Vaccinium darrowii]|uniref:Uncharacterized protein n=1 Tax=Vaccinium darrowii TaxID=229202 RepID=A0ACB7YNN1_9ERIC|nr:hypothetical protein Vadar_017381 [Vaccinium darrowii]
MAYIQYGRKLIQSSDRVLHHPLLFAAQGVRYRKLEVILTTTIDKLGKAGETVKVAPGYFRNHLMPKLLAVPNIDKFAHLISEQRKIYEPKEVEEVKVVKKTDEDHMKEYHTAAKRLDNAKLVLRRFGSGENELRSPVTKDELVAEVARQLFVRIEPENLQLPAPLTSLGEFELPLRLPKSIPLPPGKVQWTLNVKIRRNSLAILAQLYVLNSVIRRNCHKNTVPNRPLFLTSMAATTDNVTVAADVTGHYLTISEAVEAAPINRNIRYFINVKPGVYQENVRIPEDKTYIALIGSGADNTKITANLSMLHDVKGNNFLLQDIIFENSAGLGSIVGQAVALSSTSEYSVYYKTTILGYQDTLYAWEGRQFYRDCNIYGSVDFIFGDAIAVFQNCNLYARLPDTVFTAQSWDSMSSTSGYVMQNRSFTNSPELKLSLPNAKSIWDVRGENLQP